MPVTMTTLRSRTREVLRDKTTRPDATVITPFWSDAEVLAELNAAIDQRIADVEALYSSWYVTTKTYTGITDAIASTSDQQYKLPGMESDASSIMRQWIIMRRDDLDTKPVVSKIDPEMQDPAYAGLFDGLYTTYPENLFTASETVSIITNNRLRILPAPAASTSTYKLWYRRYPTAMVATTDNMDIPDVCKELIAHDAAISLKSQVNAMSARGLITQRDRLLADFKKSGEVDQGPRVYGEVRL